MRKSRRAVKMVVLRLLMSKKKIAIKRLRWTIYVRPSRVDDEINNDSETQGLSTIAKGGMLNLVGLFFSLVFNFTYQFVLIRILSPAEVGLFNLGLTITGIIGLIVIFGLDRTVVRQIAYFSGKKKTEHELGVILSSFAIVLFLTIFALPICFWMIGPLTHLVFKKPELAPVLTVLLISVPFAMFTRLAMGVLQAYKLMKPLVLIEQICIPFIR